MTAAVLLCAALLLAAMLGPAAAHVCLINPAQRGLLNITSPGDQSCARPQYPCGGQTPSAGPYPSFPRYSDGWFTTDVQENLNHYEVGYPGYIDLSWTSNLNPTNESDFTVIGIISDTNFHQQAYQNNLTFWAQAPNINCAHCILRVRYISHKPEVPPFYQCADVQFKTHSELPQRPVPLVLDPRPANPGQHPKGNNDTKLQGIGSWTWWWWWSSGSEAEFAAVDVVTGYIEYKSILPFAIRRRSADQDLPFILDQIYAYNNVTKTAYFLGASADLTGGFPKWEGVPDKLVSNSSAGLHITQIVNVPAPIVGLALNSATQTLYALMIRPQGGQFVYSLATLDPNTGVLSILSTSAPTSVYTNFQWIEGDWNTGHIFVLAYNQNSLYSLDSVIYAFDLSKNTVTMTPVNTGRFVISGFHARPEGGLLATSPGHFDPNNSSAWWLVVVDPFSGLITPQFQIAPAGFAQPHLNQVVFNGYDPVTGLLYAHFDMWASYGASVAVIDVQKQAVEFSPPVWLGDTHNLAYVPA
eukprot:m.223022 g.223022  ORF g.223022 m.223022 type:complete len:527 (-) comp10863_c0_seq1:43-1623(-)